MLDGYEKISSILKGKSKTFKTGEHIFFEGDSGDCIYLIESGSVEVMLDDPEFGDGLVLALLHKGEIFGEMSLFSDTRTRSAVVKATDNTAVRVCTTSDFLAAAKENQEVWIHLVKQLSDRLRATNRRYSDRAFHNVKARIAHILAELGSKKLNSGEVSENDITFKMTRTDLGRLVNCSREVAGQAVLDLTEEGLVSASGRSIQIHDMESLKRYNS